jgi:signal transduction histidine kinase/ligand-binding sensor domain-containing protein/DNA-binding response OmpR family regulator
MCKTVLSPLTGIYLVTVFFFVSISGLSQNKGVFFHELSIEGTPFNKKTNVIYEDSYGFLWIGTDNGLFRYDGNALLEFQYDVFDSNSIPNNSVNSIVEDVYNNLWIGTESYLVLYDRDQNRFKGYYKDNGPRVLGESSDGHIWANLRKSGLVRITPHKRTDSIRYDTDFDYVGQSYFSKVPIRVSTLAEDSFGRNWIGTREGIFALEEDDRLMPTGFEFDTRSLKDNGKNTFLAATDKGIYLLGYDKATRRLRILERYTGFLEEGNHATAELTSLALDPKANTIWVGTTEGLLKGLRKNNKYTFEFFESDWIRKGRLLNDQISSTALDRYGNLWIGSLRGVNKLIGRASIFEYEKISHPGYLENEFPRTLYFDKGTLWAGVSSNGLYRFDNKDNTGLRCYSSNNRINFISPDFENSQLLINDGKLLLQSTNFSRKVQFDTLKEYDVPVQDAFYLDHNEIWVGLWSGGLDIINTVNGLTDFKKEVVKRSAGNNTSVLLRDSHGNVWVGTRGTGLYQVDLINEQMHHFLPSEPNGLTSNAILCLKEDTKNELLWIGTRGGGLNVYDYRKKRFSAYGKEHGLLSNTVAAIQQGKNGHLWLSTRRGLARFDAVRKKFVTFGIEDGITENHFSFNSSSATKARGNVFFGCRDGFYRVRTQNFRPIDLKPETVITKLTTLGEEKNQDSGSADDNLIAQKPDSGNPLTLPYDKNNILLEFSSLDLTAPRKNEYAYMLEGVNDYWIHTQASNQSANYNDLPPGDYSFKVKSTNSDGVWNESPAILQFTIAPPFWLSPWAMLMYLILAATGIWVTAILIRRWYRLKKHLVAETVSRQKDNEHHRMKMIFFTDISHELRTPLTLIQGSIEKILRQSSAALDTLTARRIHDNSQRMGRLIDQIMDIRKFDVGEFKIGVSKGPIFRKIGEIKKAFEDFAKVRHIEYRLEIPEDGVNGWYDPEILEKIVFNLLSNAFKFTPEQGEITVSAKSATLENGSPDFPREKLQDGLYVQCSVRDNGVGIPKEDLNLIFDRYYQSTKIPTKQLPGTGIGMELVHKLIESHHGRIKVESEEHRFTEFTFLLPIQKKHYAQEEFGKVAGEIKQKQPTLPNRTQEEGIHESRKERPKILLVEDNAELRSMLKEELSSDFCVLEAADGKAAYDLALEQTPQLIVSDILMPVENGISLLKRLKKNPEVSPIPVFMLTAKDSHETKIECLGLGADDYIEKPFSLEFVKWKVKNTLSARRRLREKYSKVITTEPSEVAVVSNDEKLIKKLIEIVENSMDDKLLSVEYLASEAGMSRASLYRKLQAILNETPVNFIKQIRLKRAAQLLQANAMYISEVAYRTGFNNQKYFSKCFSKVYGMSPSEYARQFSNLKDKKPAYDFET